jgi:uncharacterized protein YkwD
MARIVAALAFLLALSSAGAVRAADSTDGRCADADLVPDAYNLKRVEKAIVCELNIQRVDAGLVPLAHDPLLNRSAQQKSDDMVAMHYFAHEAAGRPKLFDRISATGYFFAARGGLYTENLGVGPREEATAANMVAAWMQSDHHRVNILLPAFRDVGIGATIAGPDPVFYADRPSVVFATDFGRRYWRRPSNCARRPAGADPAAAPPQRWCTARKHRRTRR